MPQSLSILLYGRDSTLLQSRRLVLEKCSHKVWATTDIAKADSLVDIQCPDLLIFCHSLSPEQCEQALAFAHARWPKIKVLVLTAGASGCQDSLSDEVLDAMEGPARLISTVDQIAEPGPPALSHVH